MTPDLLKSVDAILAAPERATDEEISRAVAATRNVCWHEWGSCRVSQFSQWRCATCGQTIRASRDEHGFLEDPPDNPDFCTDPRAWWPLAKELLLNDFNISGATGEGMTFWRGYADDPEDVVGDKVPGRAACIAWLKMWRAKK